MRGQRCDRSRTIIPAGPRPEQRDPPVRRRRWGDPGEAPARRGTGGARTGRCLRPRRHEASRSRGYGHSPCVHVACAFCAHVCEQAEQSAGTARHVIITPLLLTTRHLPARSEGGRPGLHGAPRPDAAPGASCSHAALGSVFPSFMQKKVHLRGVSPPSHIGNYSHGNDLESHPETRRGRAPRPRASGEGPGALLPGKARRGSRGRLPGLRGRVGVATAS